ncbi:uncharacterized protein EI90DRAFT_1710542 [Cantharellus anzutake]|uniref:uncharacterized protein n=1 Tax=Cantharellus anzutake TaxID=1750568 RepID=UPI0019054FD4|nr:uncharacterized protein EI90DRAFT_1710542 [Cantharellus anzutake]KAF8341269.1 hypothetical protein EI90DRAFT_1710542 [Cantharellus anzutake]
MSLIIWSLGSFTSDPRGEKPGRGSRPHTVTTIEQIGQKEKGRVYSTFNVKTIYLEGVHDSWESCDFSARARPWCARGLQLNETLTKNQISVSHVRQIPIELKSNDSSPFQLRSWVAYSSLTGAKVFLHRPVLYAGSFDRAALLLVSKFEMTLTAGIEVLLPNAALLNDYGLLC